MQENSALNNEVQTKNLPLQNKISSESFIVKEKITGQDFELDVSFKSANHRWANWGREYLIQWAGNYTCVNKQTLSARKSTFEAKRNHIAKIVTWASHNKPEASLASWTENDILNLIRAITFNEITLPNRNHTDLSLPILNKETVLKTVWHIKNSGKLYRQGLLSDGYLGHTAFDNLVRELKSELALLGTNYNDWSRGGSHESVPLEVATLMLLEAINSIRSDETKALRAYFIVQRTSAKINPESSIFKKNTFLDRVYHNKELKFQTKSNLVKHREFIESVKKHYLNLGGSDCIDPIEFILSIKSHAKLNKEVRNVYDACKVAFFCLTGIRVHEMKQTNSQDYYYDVDGVWRFLATEDKTQGGTKQLRAISGVAAEAADVMCDLSYINKRKRCDNQKTYLFGLYTAMKTHFNNDNADVDHSGAAISREHFGNRINVFFNKVVDKHGDQILDECKKVLPHGFRHSFVDFVLRRFDGNIHDAIRDHFRHCMGGEFTNTYTDSKAHENVENAAQQKYMQDLIFQMVGDNSQDFTGPIALFIQNEVSKFKYVSEEELAPFIESITDDLMTLIPHEYGYCCVLKSRLHLAKCLDKKTGIAKVLNGCFELCSGCPNSFHHEPSNKSAIIRNVISHESFLENFPIKNTPQSKVSKKVVITGRKILDKMDSNHDS